jgi:cytoskeletal protein CcmA (bactofilin family)
MACPSCGHKQSEPRLAISSDCRACGEHFEVRRGRPAPRPGRPSFFRANLDGPAEATVFSPARSLLKVVTGPRQLLLRLLFSGEPKRRDVSCFDCQRVHSALDEASATNCPDCGAYISLRNYEIRDNWSRSIETRGNVRIHRGGSISGVSVRCHHLEVDGKFNGSVDCSGDFIIRSSAKILGRVHCAHLRVERRARVEFSCPVRAHEITLDGELAGDLICSGRLLLQKKALLTGDITVGSLMIKDGARHHGSIATHVHEQFQDSEAIR